MAQPPNTAFHLERLQQNQKPRHKDYWSIDYTNAYHLPSYRVARTLSRLYKYLPFWDETKTGQKAQELFNFLATEPGFDDGQPGVWHGNRILGAGSFGKAGLWEKVDRQGEIVDRIVVKESPFLPVMTWNKTSMPLEAIIMHQLRYTRCNTIVQIRNFATYQMERKWRLYFEFCPYTTLNQLRGRYTRWGTYLPEPFLWHVLHCLVKAIKAMKEGSFYDNHWKRDESLEVLHLDLKSENIFLGSELRQDLKASFQCQYPAAKMGDFGLSTLTNRKDERNQKEYITAGTRSFMAPEQHKTTRNGRNGIKGMTELKQLDWRMHVWSVGMLMWELLLLREWPGTIWLQPRQDGHAVEEIKTGRNPEYGKVLRDLVRECLRPAPQQRPPIESIEQVIEEGLRQTTQQDWQSRVYYKGTEINDMPIGTFQPELFHHFQDKDGNPFLNGDLVYVNADDEPLRPPAWKWNVDNNRLEIVPHNNVPTKARYPPGRGHGGFTSANPAYRRGQLQSTQSGGFFMPGPNLNERAYPGAPEGVLWEALDKQKHRTEGSKRTREAIGHVFGEDGVAPPPKSPEEVPFEYFRWDEVDEAVAGRASSNQPPAQRLDGQGGELSVTSKFSSTKHPTMESTTAKNGIKNRTASLKELAAPKSRPGSKRLPSTGHKANTIQNETPTDMNAALLDALGEMRTAETQVERVFRECFSGGFDRISKSEGANHNALQALQAIVDSVNHNAEVSDPLSLQDLTDESVMGKTMLQIDRQTFEARHLGEILDRWGAENDWFLRLGVRRGSTLEVRPTAYPAPIVIWIEKDPMTGCWYGLRSKKSIKRSFPGKGAGSLSKRRKGDQDSTVADGLEKEYEKACLFE